MKTITINYLGLKDSIEQLEKDYPSRMHGDIDMLRVNIKYKLFDFLSGGNLVLEVDDEKKEALIGGKQIEGDVYALYNTNENEPTTSEKIYMQLIKAKEQAKRFGFYEKVFEENNESKNENG